MQPFSLKQTGTLLNRHLAHFVPAIDSSGIYNHPRVTCLRTMASSELLSWIDGWYWLSCIDLRTYFLLNLLKR